MSTRVKQVGGPHVKWYSPIVNVTVGWGATGE